MSRTSITITGGKELQAALRNMGPELQEVVGQIVEGTGLELRGDIVKRYNSGPASGTMYYRIYDPETGFTNIFAGDSEGYIASVKGQMNLSPTHRSSAAGESPMTDTGRLANATVYKVVNDMTVEVSNDVFYAAWLEYGTTQMAPRPAWRPAVEEMAPLFHSRLETAIARFTK